MSSTGTLQAMDADDGAWIIDLASGFFPGGAAKAMFSSEGGLGFYWVSPIDTEMHYYGLSNVSRMTGTVSPPRLMLTFHPQADLRSYQVKLQRSGNTTIIFAQHSQWSDPSRYGYDAAIRIDGAVLTFIGQAGYHGANVYWHELYDEDWGGFEVQQELVAEQAVDSIIQLTAQMVVLPVLAHISVPGIPLGNPKARGYVGNEPKGFAAAKGPLGAGAALSMAMPVALARAGAAIGAPRCFAVTVPQARAKTTPMLGQASASALAYPVGLVSAPSMLRAPIFARVVHDFTGLLGHIVSVFVMDLVTPTGSVRIPISSWQATLQTGSSNYVQCVIPACDVWQEAINAATEFVIYRRAVLPSGAAIEYEMARAPAGQLQFDRGPQRNTCTVSGYSEAFAESVDPPAAYDRALTGVRSISSGSSYRVRCAVDWLLRPGHCAFVRGAPFIVKFINYYAPSEWDCYMDVGG